MRVCSGPRQRSGSYQVMRPPEGPVRGAGQVGLRAAREGRQQVDGSPRRVPTWYPPDGGRTTPQIISAGRSVGFSLCIRRIGTKRRITASIFSGRTEMGCQRASNAPYSLLQSM